MNPPYRNKISFSEYGHVAFQIKAAYNNILANVLLLHLHSKVDFFSFLKVVMLHNQINENEAYDTMHANVLPFYTPLTSVWE